MSFPLNFSNDPSTQTPYQKPKKIYFLPTRKSYNVNRKKLNQLVQINSQTIQQSPQLPLEGTIKRYLTSDKTQLNSIRKSSNNRSKEFNIWEKRKELKATIISDISLQTINHQSNNDKIQRPRLQNSLRINFAKPSHSPDLQLIKIQQSCGNLPSLIQKDKSTLVVPKKKKSCPYPNKRRSISFCDETNHTPVQQKHKKDIFSEQFSPMQMDSIRFLKNGKVNGHKIYNLGHEQVGKNEQILRSQVNQTDLNKKNSDMEANHIIQKYYSLIKNTDYGRMTNHSGKKVIKNHFDKLQAKRNNQERRPSRIDHAHTETFMKIQAMFTNKNKTQADEQK